MLLRATRKSQGVRLDDAAGAAGVGPVFAGEFERGKESVQFDLALKLLAEVGLQLQVDVPDSALPLFKQLQETGLHPLPRRASRKPAKPTKGTPS
jgi:transcriptional regulator with XRE-family HTH domain